MKSLRYLAVALAVASMVACGGGSDGVTGSSANKTARLELSLTNMEIRPLGGGWSYFAGGQDTIRETAGVGVQLQSAKVTLEGESVTVPCSGRVPANGQTASQHVCTFADTANAFYTGWYTFDAIRVGDATLTIYGVDDNGHSVSATASCGVYAETPRTDLR